MVCYSPLTAWHPRVGKQPVFSPRLAAQPDSPFRLGCGQCIGCRLSHSLDWATRCMHEFQMHASSCFLTLTYDNSALPRDGGLVRDEIPRFMKRLRKNFAPGQLSVFYCGEYGDLRLRPHYHAILFGTDFFDDRVSYRRSGLDHELFTSELLSDSWSLGHAVIGSVSFESAAYVARYSLKKITGKSFERDGFRRHCQLDTGEVLDMERPFAFSSNRPAIGRRWIERYLSDVYPHDEVIMRTFPRSPPRYYDEYLESVNPDLLFEVKERRLKNMASNWSRDRHSDEALFRQMNVKKEIIKILSRSLDQ